MKNAKITIRPADIAKIEFNNQFKSKPGEALKLKMRNGIAVKVNNEAPTNAVVRVKIEASTEDGTISFNVETMTAVVTSTYIDNLEDVIKKQYSGIIMLNVNEKVRAIAQATGLNINFPAVVIPHGEQDENNQSDSLDDILNFKGKK